MDTWLQRKSKRQQVKQLGSDMLSNLRSFNQSRKLKKVCLTLMAKHAQDSEIDELRKVFKNLDTDDNGTLSRKELLVGIQRQAKAMQISDNELEELMQIDSDGSGEIDYTEFLAAVLDRQIYFKREAVW